MDCSLTGSFIHGTLQARLLECGAIPFSRGYSRPRDWTQASWIAGRLFLPSEPPGKPNIISVQLNRSVVSDSATPSIAAHQASLPINNSQSPAKPMPTELVMPSNHLILCGPLLLLPSIFPSIGVFSNEAALRTRWPKYWSFSFSISPANEHPGLISFRMDWLDLLAVQGTLKSLLQSKASIFGAQLSSQSNSHMHTWPLEKP